LSIRLLILSVLIPAIPCWSSTIYSYDDGTGGGGYLGTVSAYWFWLNAFQVVPGGETITTVQLAFHPAAPLGADVTAYVWRDPNNDGNPSDAAVVASLAGTVAGTGDVFFDFSVTPYTFSPGEWFFVGGGMWLEAYAPGPSTDFAGSGNNSWVALRSTNDPDNLGGAEHLLVRLSDVAGGVWMARAVGTPVPEPSAALLVMGGLALLWAYRRRPAKRH